MEKLKNHYIKKEPIMEVRYFNGKYWAKIKNLNDYILDLLGESYLNLNDDGLTRLLNYMWLHRVNK